MTRRPRLQAGIALAAVLALATPVVAQAKWGAAATSTLSVSAAPFGVTATATPSGGAAMLDADNTDTATGYVGVDLRRLTGTGAVGWTTGRVTVTASAPGGSGATVRYAQATGSATNTCSALTSWSADAAQPSTVASLPSPGAGAGTLVCVRVTATGLTATDNGRVITVSFTPTVANGGWTASATTVTTTLAIAGARVPAPVAKATCSPVGPVLARVSFPGAPQGTYSLRIDPATGALTSAYGTVNAAELATGWYVSPANVTMNSGRSTITFQIVDASGAVVAAVDATFNGSSVGCIS